MSKRMADLEQLRYPVGRMLRTVAPLDTKTREELIGILEALPGNVRALVSGLTDAELDTPYRPGGWTVRQVVHHVPDSHMNAYIRMKLAVTEDQPNAKTYEEAKWAELPEAKSGPIGMSLDLLDALHRRWVSFLRLLPEPDFRKTFLHPEWGTVSIDDALGMYAWHCRHHTEHIRNAVNR